MKTYLITIKAKQISIYIEEKVIKEAELPANTKKIKPKTTTTTRDEDRAH